MTPQTEVSPDAFADHVLDIFARHGDDFYGEAVSQREHAEQCAHFAAADGADEDLIIAALLHDIGHLIHKFGEDAADRGIDTRHERIGAGFLRRGFPASVTEPIALHVAAKRYLATCKPGYIATLSEVSLQSFTLQGGMMSPEEVAAFEAHPWHAAALRLRAYDEMGKIVGVTIAPFSDYAPMLRTLIGRHAASLRDAV